MYIGSGLIVNAVDSATGIIAQPLSDWDGQVVGVRHIAGPAEQARPARAGLAAAP
jgi:hypothetical protein